MRTKEEILNQYARISNNDILYSIPESQVKSAMDEHSKEVAIDFAKWIDEKELWMGGF
jgi:hypothetical protein